MSVDRIAIRAQVILEEAREPWRDALQKLLIEGLTTRLLATFFVGTQLERQGDFAIVRCANGFNADWLRRNYRAHVARVLEVAPTRVVFALAGQDVQLDPPTEDESA